MKLQCAILSAFICATIAVPTPSSMTFDAVQARDLAHLRARQSINDESDDLTNGPCRDVTFIFARGSLESGNMVCW